MTLKSLPGFLLGHRQSIRQVADCESSTWLGFVLVISAALAREYDGEDLLAEPWHLLIPLAASIASSLVLFGLLRVTFRRKSLVASPDYRTFLSCFWMTAPLAWLYAIPVERFLSPSGAVRINLALLGIVAFWRVVLITRVSSVLYRVPHRRAFFAVMLFSDALMLAVLFLTPLPVFSLMGGIRLSESEQVLQGTAFWVGFLGVVTAPVWVGGTLWAAIAKRKEVGEKTESNDSVPALHPRVSRGLWWLAAATVMIGIAVLPFTQPQQRNRWRVERLLESENIAEAVAFLSSRQRQEFPPHWDPPPRFGYGQRRPPIWKILDHLERLKSPAWIRDIYVRKLANQTASHGPWAFDLSELSDEELSRYVAMISQWDSAFELAQHHRYQVQKELYTYTPDGTERVEKMVPSVRREALRKLEEMAVVAEEER